MLKLIIFHPGDLGLYDILAIFGYLMFYLFPFFVGGLGMFIYFKNKRKDDD